MKVEGAVTKTQFKEKLITVFLIALFLAGASLLARVGLPWLMSSTVFQRSVQSFAFGEQGGADELSQREVHLQRQALRLGETLLALDDLRVTVVIDDDTEARARQINVLVNRKVADVSLGKALQELLWSGLALRESRGDRIVVQFHAFNALGASAAAAPKALPLVPVAWHWFAGLGLVLLGGLGLMWRRHTRDIAPAEPVNDYQVQLQQLKSIAKEEPARVAGVLTAWLNDERQ